MQGTYLFNTKNGKSREPNITIRQFLSGNDLDILKEHSSIFKKYFTRKYYYLYELTQQTPNFIHLYKI